MVFAHSAAPLDRKVGEHSRKEAGEVIACLDVARVHVRGPSSLVAHRTMVHGNGEYMFVGWAAPASVFVKSN